MFSTKINKCKGSDGEELVWNRILVLLRNRPIHRREVPIGESCHVERPSSQSRQIEIQILTL